MEHISFTEVTPDVLGNEVERRTLSGPLNTTDVAVNHYELGPGERLAGLHAHMDQEEVFIVVEGETMFKTMDGEVAVGENELIRFAPGEFQSGKNDSDGEAVVFALGAPRDSEDVRVTLTCSECGHDSMCPSVLGNQEVLVCPNCDDESAAACPECGRDELRVTLSEEKRPISICQNCGVESRR